MLPEHLIQKANAYLQRLCVEIPTRRLGSAGNRAATDFVAQVAASFGFQVECPAFACMDWTQEGARLAVNDESFESFVSPYSLGCSVYAPLVVVSTIDELETINAANQVLLLRGDLAKEQLMPKNFVFYNPDEHKRIIQLLETKSPRAIIAATTRNPETSGAVYPFPLIEDGDFDIPSVYLTEEEGDRLARHVGAPVSLDIRATRIPATGCNVIARKGVTKRRVVLTAHVDAKDGTPGALDDAAGVTTLLLLAERLRDYRGQLGIEIAILNGEDHYSAAGEMQYLKIAQFDDIMLCINLDDLGFHQGSTAFSLYECSDALARTIRNTLTRHPGIVEGEQWHQGDHMVFVQNKAPALAITSEKIIELMSTIAHTTQDVPALVDCSRLADTAVALYDLLVELEAD